MTKPLIIYRPHRTDAGKPRPAPSMFPYIGHRTMDQIMKLEEIRHRNISRKEPQDG